jgi:[protein-PII] uridylyltransferase
VARASEAAQRVPAARAPDTVADAVTVEGTALLVERIAVIAVGGYGRGEMAPFSDVDLLFLTPYKITAWAESVIESMLYILWDLKLKVGHASRTIRDCLRLGARITRSAPRCSNAPPLAGDAGLASELRSPVASRAVRRHRRDFIEAKLEERERAPWPAGRQRYMLEPNVKEGKGGLRDLQSLFWIAKYIHRVATRRTRAPRRLHPRGIRQLREAEDFLWAVRAHLHLMPGARPNS